MKKKFVLSFLLLLCVQVFVFGQKKKKPLPLPPPKIEKEVQPAKLNDPSSNPILKLVSSEEKNQSFAWEINADTLLVKNSLFKEIVQFNCFSSTCDDVEIVKNSTSDDFQMKKKRKEDTEIRMMSFFQNRTRNSFKINKNILSLTDDKTKSKRQFKIILDKKGKSILYLQDVVSKKKYLPSEPDYPSPSISM